MREKHGGKLWKRLIYSTFLYPILRCLSVKLYIGDILNDEKVDLVRGSFPYTKS